MPKREEGCRVVCNKHKWCATNHQNGGDDGGVLSVLARAKARATTRASQGTASYAKTVARECRPRATQSPRVLVIVCVGGELAVNRSAA